jgi:hypothetical protein
MSVYLNFSSISEFPKMFYIFCLSMFVVCFYTDSISLVFIADKSAEEILHYSSVGSVDLCNDQYCNKLRALPGTQDGWYVAFL